MTSVDGLAGVIISTSPDHFEAMESFYVAVFGGHLRSRRPGFVNFEWGRSRLTVTLHSAVRGRSEDPARIIVNFECADPDRLAASLENAGHPIVRHPDDESWGGRVCTVEDPDGNYVQFMRLP